MQSSATDGAASNSQDQDQQLRAQVELLRSPPEDGTVSHSPDDAAARDSRDAHPSTSPDPLDGYDAPPADSQQDAAAKPLNHQKTEADSYIHPDLRAIHGRAPGPNMMSTMGPPPVHSPGSSSQSTSPNPMLHANPPHQPHNANLAPAPPQGPPAGQDPTSPDGRMRPKRELSQSKRAAQNRAAQRAFRQRKETYIRQLEQENKAYQEMEKTFKSMQSENYALREYVIALQSRLLEVQGDFPHPPPNVNLSQPHGGAGSDARMPDQDQQASSSSASGPVNSGTPLEAVARAVAGLAAQEQMNQNQNQHHQYDDDTEMKSEPGTQEDTRTADEINRHLQVGEGEAEQQTSEV